jgi:hypothetical protein
MLKQVVHNYRCDLKVSFMLHDAVVYERLWSALYGTQLGHEEDKPGKWSAACG